MTALGLDSLKELLGTVPAATGAGPGGPGEAAAAGPAPAPGARRAGARERGEAHRERGNAAFRARDFEGALDWYTRAINANQADCKAVCNRCAAHTALGRYREAVADAEFGLELEPAWAKLHGRKAAAHFYLKEFDESFVCYTEALKLAPGSEEYRDGLRRAEEEGGSRAGFERKKYLRTHRAEEQLRRELEAKAEQERRERAALDREAAAQRELARKAAEHRAELQRYQRLRREGAAKWRASTLLEGEPEEDRGRSIRIDCFGHLRGKCLTSPDCMAWARDATKARNWNDMSALTCEMCGCSYKDHEDCGRYPTQNEEPRAPHLQGPGLDMAELKGKIHTAQPGAFAK